jgi:hypothetical protein
MIHTLFRVFILFSYNPHLQPSCTTTQVYERAEYAGNVFKTRAYEESHPSKHEDSHFVCDYMKQSEVDDSSDDEDKGPRRRRA